MSGGIVAIIVVGSIALYFALIIATYEIRAEWLGRNKFYSRGFYEEQAAFAGVFWPVTLVWFIGYIIGRIIFGLIKDA